MAMIQSSSRGTIVGTIYSSGSVAAGAAIDSGVLDLSPFREIEVFVDNTAGTVLRDLAMLSYLDDGTTLIDSIVLRRCGFGTAPAGSVYAPGAIRGYVGPNPPGGTTGVHVLYDATSAANTALDTGALATEDTESLRIEAFTSGGTTNIGHYVVRDDNGIPGPGAGFAAAAYQITTWGPGFATGGEVGLVMGEPVQRRSRFTTSAAGPGNTVRLIVVGRGRTPGAFAQQMILPTKAKLTLGAGGAGAARLTVIAR